MTDRATRQVLEIAHGVLCDLDLEAVLDRVLAAARELTGATYAALGVLDESRSALERFVTLGMDAETRSVIGPPPSGRGVLGVLIHDPVALRVADIGEHPLSYGFPVGHPPMRSFLGVPVMVAGEPFGNLYLTDKVGEDEFTDEDEASLALLAEFAGVAIDHARRFTGSEARRGELERAVETLDATVGIARAIGGRTDLGEILELVAKRGRALVSARALVVEVQHGEELVVAAAAGALPRGLVGQHLGLEDTVAGAALRTQRTQRLEDRLNRSRFEQHGLGQLGVTADAGIAVPLVFQGHAYGTLIALDRVVDGPAFTANDERLLLAFATSAATAIATARSFEAERRSQRMAAAEQERRRWARELHDATLQGLAALHVSLAAAQRDGARESIDEAVDRAVAQLQSDIANLRALITDLRPAALDRLGVHAAIEVLAAHARTNGVTVDLRIGASDRDDGDRLHDEIETAIYRLVQEALTNAVKHGRADRVIVELVEDAATVSLTVNDNGPGFDPRDDTDGFGLIGMHERVELLAGTLRIDSAPGHGTTITASLPARRRADHRPPAHLGMDARAVRIARATD